MDSFCGRSQACPNNLAGGGVVKSGWNGGFADGVEQPGGAQRRNIARIFRYIEADADVALRAEVIDFVRCQAIQKLRQTRRVGEVGEVQKQPRVSFVPIREEMIHPRGVEAARPALDAVNFIPLREQQLG